MRSQARATSLWWGATLPLELDWSAGILPRWADSTSLLGPEQCTGLGLGLLGDFQEVTKGGVAGVVTAIGPLGAVGRGSAPGALGGFGGQGFVVLPPLPVPPPVPGGTLLLPSDAFPWGAGHGTLRVTRTGEQAGKALRSQGHQYARVM